MNILEKLEQLMALIEASGEEDPETVRDDSGEPPRSKTWGKSTQYSDEQPAQPTKAPNKGGAMAPASKYASALQNYGGDVSRTGVGGRSQVAASSAEKINQLLKIISEFIDSYGQLSLSKKQKAGGPSGEGGSYLDKHRQAARRLANKEKGIEEPQSQQIDKMAQNKSEVIYRELNSMMDPATDPQRRKSSMNMVVQYIKGIPLARQTWKKDWINDQAAQATESKMKEADAKFFDKNPGAKFKGMTRNQFASRLAHIMKTAAGDAFLKAFPNWEGDDEYNNKSELAWRSIAAIQKFLSNMNQEGKQFQYIPGAFGEPPRVVEVDSSEWQAYQHNKAAKRSGKKGTDVGAKAPTVRSGGAGAPKPGGKPTKVAEPKMSDDEFARMLDNEFESVHRAWNGMLQEAIVMAAADRKPQWWDDI